MSSTFQLNFWQRVGLDETDGEKCKRAVARVFNNCEIEELADQGYCSCTLVVLRSREFSDLRPSSPDVNGITTSIVQLRPKQHAIDCDLADAAKAMYGALAPSIHALDVNLPGHLRAFEMERLHGTPFSRLQPATTTSPHRQIWAKQCTLIESFASLLARSWSCSLGMTTTTSPSRHIRADSPMADTTSPLLSLCTGKVGANILPKISKLSRELPALELRTRAAGLLEAVQNLRNYPIVLNHGDLIPSNVLVDEDRWVITGLVDWAEAEYLPFGTCLYGLEHLLGFVDVDVDVDASGSAITESPSHAPKSQPRFRYYHDAPLLRKAFWLHLVQKIGVRSHEVKNWISKVSLARELGIFLWYGYAWDDGKIDRVVNEQDDAVEVECLRTFLNIPEPTV